jgi:hypothetical protein
VAVRAWMYPPIAGSLVILLRLALLPLLPIPVPYIHDEFSYLLGADTFAAGRVTNPPHPMWVHLETFHVNQEPTYCSKYPPAQALFLAFGQVVFGHPWFGVCLSMGVMFAALCWMLQGWFPPRYALPATLLAIFGWGLTSAWMNSYWGGAVAAAGGALLIGAIPRLARKPGVFPALTAAIGLAVLANSRPFEGLLTALAAGVVLVWWMWRSGASMAGLGARRVAIPFLAVLAATGVAMAYYNWRTTGSPTLLPYTANQRAYSTTPFFYVLPPLATPIYHHEIQRRYWVDWVLPYYRNARAHPLSAIDESAVIMRRFYLQTPAAVAFLCGLFFAWSAHAAAALTIALGPVLGLMLAETALPHYLAPVFGAFLLLSAAGLQVLDQWKRPLCVSLLLGISATWCAAEILQKAAIARMAPEGVSTRPLLIQKLHLQNGRHLVIVRYGPNHSIHHEWVYNRADIDASEIVWAQDMGAEKNRELLDYYRSRKVWLLEPDRDPLAVTPYPEPGS